MSGLTLAEVQSVLDHNWESQPRHVPVIATTTDGTACSESLELELVLFFGNHYNARCDHC